MSGYIFSLIRSLKITKVATMKNREVILGQIKNSIIMRISHFLHLKINYAILTLDDLAFIFSSIAVPDSGEGGRRTLRYLRNWYLSKNTKYGSAK